MAPQPQEMAESAKVAGVGAWGLFATFTLGEIHLLVGIGVGCITILYVGTKLFFLIKSGGKSKSD